MIYLSRFRMRLMQFNYTVFHTAGKNSDTLSRAPVGTSCHKDDILNQEVDDFVHQVVSHFPMSKIRLKEIREAQKQDVVCHKIFPFITNGWPDKMKEALKPFIPINGR